MFKGLKKKEIINLRFNCKKFVFFPLIFLLKRDFIFKTPDQIKISNPTNQNNNYQKDQKFYKKFFNKFKITVSISKKIGNAVFRNKIRRRIKNIFCKYFISFDVLCLVQKDKDYSFEKLNQTIDKFYNYLKYKKKNSYSLLSKEK